MPWLENEGVKATRQVKRGSMVEVVVARRSTTCYGIEAVRHVRDVCILDVVKAGACLQAGMRVLIWDP
jgi:hypothetical protein